MTIGKIEAEIKGGCLYDVKLLPPDIDCRVEVYDHDLYEGEEGKPVFRLFGKENSANLVVIDIKCGVAETSYRKQAAGIEVEIIDFDELERFESTEE